MALEVLGVSHCNCSLQSGSMDRCDRTSYTGYGPVALVLDVFGCIVLIEWLYMICPAAQAMDTWP